MTVLVDCSEPSGCVGRAELSLGVGLAGNAEPGAVFSPGPLCSGWQLWGPSSSPGTTGSTLGIVPAVPACGNLLAQGSCTNPAPFPLPSPAPAAAFTCCSCRASHIPSFQG